MTAHEMGEQRLSTMVNKRFGHILQISRTTIRNWRDGSSKTVEDWRQLIAISVILNLSERETENILGAARLPDLTTLASDYKPEESALLELWLKPAPLAGIKGRLDSIQSDVVKVASDTEEILARIKHRANPPHMVPLLPIQGVFGRDDTLSSISSMLRLQNEEAASVLPVALQGMGGVGKTTLAIAFGHLKRSFFPDGVLWVSLGPNPTIRTLLEGWGQALGINLQAERDERACSNSLANILYNRRVMLIIDDVWEDTHARYFNVAGPQCRTLFTTRETPIAHTLATRRRTRKVDILKPQYALALLHSLIPEVVTNDKKIAMQLCERLEFLPLALTLAGRFLANEADVISRMRRLLAELIERRASRLMLLQSEGRLGIDEDNPVSLQAILGMSVERLTKNDQERFAMLSEFGSEPLTWEADAAAHVWECSIEEAETTIAHLIQRGLVVPRMHQEYWMHALLVDYATEMAEGMNL